MKMRKLLAITLAAATALAPVAVQAKSSDAAPDWEEYDALIKEIKTNTEGQAITQIPFGKYKITEIKENDRIIAINGTKINYVWEKTAPNIVTDKTEGVGYYFTVLKNGTNEEVTYFIQIQNAQQQEYNHGGGAVRAPDG